MWPSPTGTLGEPSRPFDWDMSIFPGLICVLPNATEESIIIFVVGRTLRFLLVTSVVKNEGEVIDA